MKKFKRLFFMLVGAITILSLASCSSSTRNTSTPYGSLDLNKVIASSTAEGLNVNYTTEQYYDTMRRNGYSLFQTELKKIFYASEIQALTNLLYTDSYAALSNEDKLTLSYTDQAIDEARYDYLVERYTRTVNTLLASAIYSTNSLTTFNGYSEDDLDEYVAKYIENFAKLGMTVTPSSIQGDAIIKDPDLDTLQVNYKRLPREVIETYILNYAENYYAEKELYKIADKEYVLTDATDDGDTTQRNSYNYFTDSYYESIYEETYYTYGEYTAIIIQFNSKREALNTIEKVVNANSSFNVIDESNVDEFYLELYKTYYNHRVGQDTDLTLESNLFSFTVNEDKNDLSEFPAGVSTLITDTLEVGQYLTQPRNVSSNYIMAYHIDTAYVYSGAEDKSTQLEFDDLKDTISESEYNALIAELQTKIIETYGSSYASRAFNLVIQNANIQIYDPIIEYNFNNSYSSYYELISNVDFNNDLVAKIEINGVEHTIKVEDFYAVLEKNLGSTTIINFFQLAYADLIVSEYVSSDTMTSNSETLQAAIDTFNNNENSSYTNEIGLENYLLLAYGYKTQDQVLRYYYNASSALSSYLSTYIDESWVTDNTISDYAKRILGYLLAEGNTKYSEIFNINLDHILIYIDDDGDGSPDDPDEFLSKNSEIIDSFEAGVSALAQAIYKESLNVAYADNSLYETLSYIVKAYNRGDELLSYPGHTWDEYKTFNYLLTAEQLASSSDITQDSVSSFVTPFADYVKDIYAQANREDYSAKINEDTGNYIIQGQDRLLTEASQASLITTNTLCKSTFGYHLLVINSYEGPDTLKFTSSDDPYKYQENMVITVTDGDDEDSTDDDVTVTISSYNESENTANVEQLYIYMVQSYTGATSTLASDIRSLLSSMFTDSITAYTSNNFQTVLLLDLLNIQINDNETLATVMKVQRDYYVNQVTSYDNTSVYYDWLNDSTNYDFKRN